MASKSKVYIPTDKEFVAIINSHNSYTDCLRALGLKTSGGSSTDILKKRIKELGCSIAHFSQGKNGGNASAKYTLDEILVENSTYMNIARLKIRLINENKLEYKCNCCGISEWNDKPLVLQLEHKNGKNNDHRLENLEFLCPNCHSQTDTYAGKNKGA